HEIRTPMNAVVGMSQLILREDISPKARDYATQIKASGNDLLTVINDILDFSKIESGNMDIVPARYEPAVLVKELANLLALNNKNPNLEIKTEINPSLPAVLEGDSTRIRQILTNIMSNAIKFTKEGSVLVSVDYDRLDERNLMLRMEVADTGIGISKNDLNSIFESFSQVNSTRNREVEGTGLGLAITKRLVELMDGTIGVESESGKGSVFTVEIPQFIISDEPPIHSDADGKEDTSAEFSAPNAKVLVVDDNQVNLFIMNGMLEIYGIKPVSVESGERAIEEAGKDDYDIVFMDHMMPKMDGVEAARQILEKYPAYKDIPMIAFTANALEESKQKLLKEGFNDFLSKPVEPEKLTEMLMKWLPSEKIIKL
ncbi:MAG: response regulator, partial [Lachnospiraceae bacterium]|nr:response regulator [Lachnospiraceae bacterium]